MPDIDKIRNHGRTVLDCLYNPHSDPEQSRLLLRKYLGRYDVLAISMLEQGLSELGATDAKRSEIMSMVREAYSQCINK